MRTRNVTVEIITFLFIILWIYAGLSKLLDYETTKYQLGRSPYLENMAGFVAWTVPAGELLIALMLLIPRTKLIGLYASFGIMLLFTGYIYIILNHAYYIPCSCGGILSGMGWQAHFWFNIGLTVMALAGIFLSLRKSKDHFDHQLIQAQ